MRNKSFIIIILLITPFTVLGQSAFTKQTISNAGEKSTFSGGSFTWTLGEAAVGTITGTNVVMLQGFAPTMITVGTPPTPPVVGTVTQPTCILATGSVELTGLPATGIWTLTRYPGGTITTGSGITTTISGLAASTYTYTVTDANSLTSTASSNIIINAQPSTPTAPVVGTITQPTCVLATGSVALSGLPATGTWTLTKYPGGTTSTGSGTSTTISGLTANTYTYTVSNAEGCVSPSSGNIVINTQPSTPTAPTLGTITQPTCAVPTGSVVLNGLPSSGSWTVTRSPGGTTTSGSGTSTTVTGIPPGTYTFTVTNASSCTSSASSSLVLNTPPGAPSAPVIGTITHPTCLVTTGSVSISGLPSSGTWTLTRSPGGNTTSGSGTTTSVSGLAAGTYTFTVTNAEGCTSPASANAVINVQPSTPSAPVAGTINEPTCLIATGSVSLTGLPASGTWTLTRSPGGITTTGTGANYPVSGLSPGTYSYTLTNASGCTSASSDAIIITEADPGVIPKIKTKFNKEVLVCINVNDSLVQFQWYKDGSKISNEILQYVVTKGKPGIYTVETTDINGCKNFSTGVNVNGSKTISVFPNPASTNFALEFNEETQQGIVVTIFNSAGIKMKEIRTKSYSDAVLREIPVDDLDQGSYLIKAVIDNREQYFTKLIIIR